MPEDYILHLEIYSASMQAWLSRNPPTRGPTEWTDLAKIYMDGLAKTILGDNVEVQCGVYPDYARYYRVKQSDGWVKV